jgi:hypothetical protein
VGDRAFANPFSCHRVACSTNAALKLQCRSPRSTSRTEPGNPPGLAEIREAKDHSVVSNRGSRSSRRPTGALAEPWSSPKRASVCESPSYWRCAYKTSTFSERLGHENATLVLKTYGHIMPAAEHRTRRAIDDAWTRDETESDHG